MIEQDIFSLGPISSVYVGDATDSGPLVQIFDTRTQGGMFEYNCPKKFSPIRNKYIQSGMATLSFDATFYGGGDDVTRLAMGNSISTPGTADEPGGETQYSVLLIHANESVPLSVYIPLCETARNLRLPSGKQSFAEARINFRFEFRNVHVRPYTKGDAVDASTAAGSRNPLT